MEFVILLFNCAQNNQSSCEKEASLPSKLKKRDLNGESMHGANRWMPTRNEEPRPFAHKLKADQPGFKFSFAFHVNHNGCHRNEMSNCSDVSRNSSGSGFESRLKCLRCFTVSSLFQQYSAVMMPRPRLRPDCPPPPIQLHFTHCAVLQSPKNSFIQQVPKRFVEY